MDAPFNIYDVLLQPCSRAPASDLVNIKTAAVALGISLRTARYWQAAGKMPVQIRRGHRLMYRAADIQGLREKLGR